VRHPQEPQEVAQHDPQPPDFFFVAVFAPWPTSGVMPPDLMNIFHIRATFSLPQWSQQVALESFIERSTVKFSWQSLQR